jgi:hypothetical protein
LETFRPCQFFCLQIQDDKAKLLYELDNMQEQLEKANMLVNRYIVVRMRRRGSTAVKVSDTQVQNRDRISCSEGQRVFQQVWSGEKQMRRRGVRSAVVRAKMLYACAEEG